VAPANVKSEFRTEAHGIWTAALKAKMDLAFLYLRLAETESPDRAGPPDPAGPFELWLASAPAVWVRSC
jgi:hypothetical protein